MAVAGKPSAIKTISPFLEGVLARIVTTVGEDASKASLLKTVGFVDSVTGVLDLLAHFFQVTS
jgi:hypothetical protein